MSAEQRRQRILEILRSSTTPVTGTQLATWLGVSRQVIVQDIAILRAAGEAIYASPRGYFLYERAPARQRTVIAVRHTPAQTEDELLALVDAGVEVIDVIVQHPIYGELRGMLHIASQADVYAFMERMRITRAHLLSELTDGLHLHTLEARDPAALERARQVMRERGYLVE